MNELESYSTIEGATWTRGFAAHIIIISILFVDVHFSTRIVCEFYKAIEREMPKI